MDIIKLTEIRAHYSGDELDELEWREERPVFIAIDKIIAIFPIRDHLAKTAVTFDGNCRILIKESLEEIFHKPFWAIKNDNWIKDSD